MHSSMTRHCQVSRRYKATIAVLMQATLANLYIALCYAHQAKPNWAKALENAEKYKTSDDEMISPASQMALGDIYANIIR